MTCSVRNLPSPPPPPPRQEATAFDTLLNQSSSMAAAAAAVHVAKKKAWLPRPVASSSFFSCLWNQIRRRKGAPAGSIECKTGERVKGSSGFAIDQSTPFLFSFAMVTTAHEKKSLLGFLALVPLLVYFYSCVAVRFSSFLIWTCQREETHKHNPSINIIPLTLYAEERRRRAEQSA